jgi:hypothetical protein
LGATYRGGGFVGVGRFVGFAGGQHLLNPHAGQRLDLALK